MIYTDYNCKCSNLFIIRFGGTNENEIIILLVLFSFIVNTYAQEGSLKFNTTVQIKISASSVLEKQIKSYIGREIRSLGDIKIVEKDPFWIIDIVGLEITTKTGQVSGIVISVIFMQDLNEKQFAEIFPEEIREFAMLFLENAYLFPIHMMWIGSPDDTQVLSREIVTYFDSEIINPGRVKFDQMFSGK